MGMWPTLRAYLILFAISTEDDWCAAVAGCRFCDQRGCFSALPPRLLFCGPFVGDASDVVPRCCRRVLFGSGPSLISACFVLGSA